METLKEIVKGSATLENIRSGGVAEYIITSVNNHKYMVEIDLSDKVDCGESASFKPFYEKAIILMRWIRRAMDNGELMELC
jgi:hypothetical protein